MSLVLCSFSLPRKTRLYLLNFSDKASFVRILNVKALIDFTRVVCFLVNPLLFRIKNNRDKSEISV